MKQLLMATALVLAANIAQAEILNMSLGQSTTLGNGDVAIINHNGYSSTVVCSGAGAPQPGARPARKRFDHSHFEAYEHATMKIYPAQTLESNCQRYASLKEPKQAIAFAISGAREKCFEEYDTCTQPGLENEQLHFNFVGGRHGRPGCEVTAFMIGTNPK